MKIVEVINSLGSRDGAEVFFQQLCEELSLDSNVDLKIVCLWDQIDKKISEDFKNKGIEIVFCHKKNKVDFKAAKRLKKLICDFSPDIIHTHLSVLPTYALAFGFKKTKWLLFHTVHNIAQKETTLYGKIIAKMFLKKHLLNMIGISDAISKTIIDVYGCDDVYTIYNGVKLHRQLTEKKKKYDLICVARFSQQKNHKMLFDACETIYKKNNKSISLICLGKGELFDYYAEYVKGLECAKNIILAGAVTNVYDYLSESKYFILTSTHEGNPIAILEALNCGIPIIAPAVGGIPDIVLNNQEGFLFDTDSSDQLIDILSKLDDVFKSTDYDRMSKKCKARANKYSIKTCKNEYMKLFMAKLS